MACAVVEPDYVALAQALADELDRARRTLEEFAMQLCLDPVVFARHPGPLQQFDGVAQSIGEVATFLRHEGHPAVAIDAVRLEVMRDRLAACHAAPIAGAPHA